MIDKNFYKGFEGEDQVKIWTTHNNEEIGFLLLDISKSALKKQLAIQENEDAMYILLVDDEGEILVNASSRTDEECLRILSRNKDNSYIINRKNLAYGGCQIISIVFI